jgi:hypothetical protein
MGRHPVKSAGPDQVWKRYERLVGIGDLLGAMRLSAPT